MNDVLLAVLQGIGVVLVINGLYPNLTMTQWRWWALAIGINMVVGLLRYK